MAPLRKTSHKKDMSHSYIGTSTGTCPYPPITVVVPFSRKEGIHINIHLVASNRIMLSKYMISKIVFYRTIREQENCCVWGVSYGSRKMHCLVWIMAAIFQRMQCADNMRKTAQMRSKIGE